MRKQKVDLLLGLALLLGLGMAITSYGTVLMVAPSAGIVARPPCNP